MKKFMPIICSSALILLLTLTFAPLASAQLADIGVNETQRFYYSSSCNEMSGTLSAKRNLNPSPQHFVFGEVDYTDINLEIDASSYGLNMDVSVSSIDTPTSGQYYRARCYDTVYVNRYGWVNINFKVYGGI